MYMLSVEEIGRINTSADPLVRSTGPLFCVFGGGEGVVFNLSGETAVPHPVIIHTECSYPQPPSSAQPALQYYVTVWRKTASYLKQQTNVSHSNW